MNPENEQESEPDTRHPPFDPATADQATIAALMLRFKDYRLPRAERLLERMRQGEKLTEYDIHWLKTVHRDGVRARPLVQRHPEYSDLVVRAIDLFTEIIELGVRNEQAS